MTRKVFGFFLVLLCLSVIPPAYSQVSVGEYAVQRYVEVVIGLEGEIHVKHILASTGIPKQVELISGTASNVKVSNVDGQEQLFSMLGDYGVLVMPSNEELVVEYDLDDVLVQKDGLWTWDFRYLQTTSFIFPNEVDLIFSNGKPVYLADKKGIACHGCQMILEYSIDEPTNLENVTWEDKEFHVEMRSHAGLENFVFDQPSKRITFDVNQENRIVTTIIPLELLWGPYEVFLEDEKIFVYDHINNGTHSWVIMKPDISGEVSIIGTTVVPEFPIIAPLAIGFVMMIILPIIRKVNLH
ncbi:hypothetical protein NsoK4_09670 [Nitrosopumilus sp. K4]|uniref:hypothetical protein n=1 Tax=Nitrosopumilus sp. K4 TaxID=2795383 RepID=UPI001BABDAD1|nr:hypothetical protein [Nitrosopumilus sp. K4]QUC64665.1 hypothetical protein NsoK4_09670 [Nitrosopumilus sp. K4]